MFDEEKEKLKAGPDGNSMSIDTFSNSNALPGTSSSSLQQKVASTMMDVDEMGPIKIQSKTELSWVKLHAQIDAHIKNEGEEVFSKSTINAMFLLKLLLETDHDRYKDVVRSNKLGHIVNVQLKKPLVVAGNDLPAWCNAIIEAAPFLLPISVRRQWLGCTSLGVSRTIDWLQKHNKYLSSARSAVEEAERAHNLAIASNNEIQQVQAVQFAAQAADRLHEAEMKHHVGALRCDIVKVRHDDDHLLEDGLFLMNLHAQTTNKLEVQFIGENGFGDGVTQGFFSGLAKILQTRSVNKQVQMWAVDTNENEGMLVNKYGLMPKPLPPKSTDDTKMAKMRSQVLERFKFLGRLMGKVEEDAAANIVVHRSVKLNIYVNELVVQRRDLVQALLEENVHLIDRNLFGCEIVVSRFMCIVIRSMRELQRSEAAEVDSGMNDLYITLIELGRSFERIVFLAELDEGQEGEGQEEMRGIDAAAWVRMNSLFKSCGAVVVVRF